MLVFYLIGVFITWCTLVYDHVNSKGKLVLTWGLLAVYLFCMATSWVYILIWLISIIPWNKKIFK